MHPEFEELRKRSYIAYDGDQGIAVFDRAFRKIMQGKDYDKISEEDLRKAKLEILQEVFVKRFGVDKTKNLLKMEVLHLSGYKPLGMEDKRERTHIGVKTNATKIIVIAVFALMFLSVLFLYMYVQSFEETTICEDMEGYEMDLCYTNIGSKQKDPSLCEKISDPFLNSKCFATVAPAKEDPDLCEKVEKNPEMGNLYEVCVICVARKMQDKRLCHRLIEDLKIEYCYNQVQKRRDIEICPK